MHDAVSVRGLGVDDLSAAEGLLREGFPERSPRFWREALARVAGHAAFQAPGVPLGSGMWTQAGALVGVMLTPSSLRPALGGGPAQALVNLSCWVMRPPYRWRARSMLKHALARDDATYLDLTPSASVQRMLPGMGMRPVNAGTLLSLLPVDVLAPGRGGATVQPWQPGDPLPEGAPPADLLASQMALGCVPLLLHLPPMPNLPDPPQACQLLVYRRLRVRGVPTADWVYVHSHRALWLGLSAVARLLLRQGLVLMRLDARVPPGRPWHRSLRAHGVWFARGGCFEDRTDFLGSERCLFGV